MEGHKGRPKLSVVIPVYNERPTIEELLYRVQAVDIDKEVIIVDDGSTDGTQDFLKQLAKNGNHNSTVMTLPLTGYDGEIVLVQDADLEYDPQDYHRLLEPIERGMADVVFGTRFLGAPHRVLFFWHFVGNKALTTFSNMLTNLNLSDVWTCYKAFKREVLQKVKLEQDRFGFEPEVTSKVAHGGWRVYEVPIPYHGRTHAEGKQITWKDGVRGIWCTLRYNLFR